MVFETGTRFCDGGHRGGTGLSGERYLQTSEPGHVEHFLAGQHDRPRPTAIHGNRIGHEEESEDTEDATGHDRAPCETDHATGRFREP